MTQVREGRNATEILELAKPTIHAISAVYAGNRTAANVERMHVAIQAQEPLQAAAGFTLQQTGVGLDNMHFFAVPYKPDWVFPGDDPDAYGEEEWLQLLDTPGLPRDIVTAEKKRLYTVLGNCIEFLPLEKRPKPYLIAEFTDPVEIQRHSYTKFLTKLAVPIVKSRFREVSTRV